MARSFLLQNLPRGSAQSVTRGFCIGVRSTRESEKASVGDLAPITQLNIAVLLLITERAEDSLQEENLPRHTELVPISDIGLSDGTSRQVAARRALPVWEALPQMMLRVEKCFFG